jgi:K+-transporting ATPase KdpF subunit
MKLDNFKEFFWSVREQWMRNPWAKVLFLTMSLNLLIAPGVMAASGAEITRNTAYAISILYCVTIALSIYLFTVIFQPERF